MRYSMSMVTTRKSSTHVTKRTPVAKKPVSRKAVKKNSGPELVDIYPNRMTFAVSAAAGAILVLIAIIIAYS